MKSVFLAHVCMLSHFSRVQLFATLWTVACQAPLSMEFPRQEYWSGQPFPSPGDLPSPEIKPVSPVVPAMQADSLPLSNQGSLGFQPGPTQVQPKLAPLATWPLGPTSCGEKVGMAGQRGITRRTGCSHWGRSRSPAPRRSRPCPPSQRSIPEAASQHLSSSPPSCGTTSPQNAAPWGVHPGPQREERLLKTRASTTRPVHLCTLLQGTG